MTWSIVARDPDGSLAVIVASRAFAVGALCPYVRAGCGALSTQALVNPHFGPIALDLLDRHIPVEEIVAQLVASDPGQSQRQLHLIDRDGRTAAHTGKDCIAYSGHAVGDGFSVAGNMLAGEAVLRETARVMNDERGTPLALRLIRAMQAGQAAGGDKRGQQAAALLIHSSEQYPLLDLRVDDHEEPLEELMRLYRVSFERYQPFLSCLPSRDRPAGLLDRAEIDRVIERFALAHQQATDPE